MPPTYDRVFRPAQKSRPSFSPTEFALTEFTAPRCDREFGFFELFGLQIFRFSLHFLNLFGTECCCHCRYVLKFSVYDNNLLVLLKKHVLNVDKMELLKTGNQYDLLACPSSADGVSVLHVKLTDAALKAIEEYYEWTRKLKVKLFT